MENETIWLLLALGVVLVGVAREVAGDVGRLLNIAGVLAALVAGVAVLVR